MPESSPWSGALGALARNLRALGYDHTTKLWLLYSAMGVLLLAYLGWLISGSHATAVDGWGVSGFELLGAAMCIASGVVRRNTRWVPIILGAALMAWACGHLTETVETLGGATPPEVAVYDGFQLSFYPLAYVAMVLYLRGEVRRLATPNWLDGIIAGLGATALCAAFAFHAIASLTGKNALATSVNLAYPVGDVLLLLLIVGGITFLSGRDRRPWLVISTGIALVVVGDTFNLFHSSASPSGIGAVLGGIAWPAAIYLISRAMWLPRVQSDPRAVRKQAGFLLPGLAATSGLLILFVGTFKGVNGVAIGLATATLVLVGARVASSLRAMRVLTRERQQLSVTDHLTELGNRRYLFDVLDGFFADQVAAQQQRSLAFLFIDLEHFKKVNDSFGHSAGDDVLRQLGKRLAESLSPDDVVARIGGDEFGVVLMDADAAQAVGVAERISASLTQPFALEAMRAQLSANIGIALAPADAPDIAGLIECADVAMYRAKLGARPYALYEQGFSEGGSRLRLAEELRAAVDADELILHYQPQLDLRTREISTVEALVRWPHPTIGLIPPVKFLPLAEEAGLMGGVTRLVLTQAIAQCAEWRREGRNMRVSVNVSATDLVDTGLTDLVVGLLKKHGQPASSLLIEITETSVITEFERSRRVIQDLRDLGVSVSIDDFGAGFTSLAYLSSLAVEELKVDRALITRLASESRQQDVELVRATIALGHALGLRVVAEGIEDEGTLELVSELGCDLAQGYVIGRPKPADELVLIPSLVDTPVVRVANPEERRGAPELTRTA
jgi:diguanylate cyclase (GGDEF)-like protein